MAAKKNKTLAEQAQEILEQAQEKGVQSNFFFVTTAYGDYHSHLGILLAPGGGS